MANADFGLGMRLSDAEEGPWRSPSGRDAAAVDGRARSSSPIIEHALGADRRTKRLANEPERGWDDDASPGRGPSGRGAAEVLGRLQGDLDEAVFESLEGAFAAAVWQGRDRRMLLGRDALGLRTLYVARTQRRPRLWLFATEAKALLASGKIDVRFDARAMLDVFSVGHVVPPRTPFQHIAAVPPGSWWRIEARGREAQGRWGTPLVPRRDEALSPQRNSTDYLEALAAEMETHRTLLVEPSAPAALLAQLGMETGGTLRTFGPTFEQSWDPSAGFQQWLAERLDLEHAEIPLQPIDEGDWIQIVRSVETAALDDETCYLGQVYRAARVDGQVTVADARGAFTLFSAGARPVRAPWWRRGLPIVFGERSHRSARRLGRHARPRWGTCPPDLLGWIRLAVAAEPLLALPQPPLGFTRLPEVWAPPLHVEHPAHRRVLFDLRLGRLHHRLAVGQRLAEAEGLKLHHPYLAPGPVAVWQGLAPRILDGQRPPRSFQGWLARTLGRARRVRGGPLRHPSPVWPFGPGVPGWMAERLRGPALERVGAFDARAVEALVERLRTQHPHAKDAVDAARVLRRVLGYVLMSEVFGAEGVA